MKNIRFTYFLLLGLILGTSCETGTSSQSSFDRSLFLEHYAYQIIQPAITSFYKETQALQASVVQLASEKTLDNLQNAQTAWDQTYRAFTGINTLNFGPGGTEGLRRNLLEEVNLGPVDIKNLEKKIASKDNDFTDSRRNTRGLLAIEYLLFGTTSNEETLAQMDDARSTYLLGACTRLAQQAEQLNAAWQGEYVEEFVSSEGTGVKSSTTQMFNEMIRSFEGLRDTKLGIPMGLIAGQTTPQPEQVENPYSKNSLDYLLLHYQNIIKLWNGASSSVEEGPSWQTYLGSIEGGQTLVENIEKQTAKIDQVIEAIPNNKNLQELALENDPALTELYTELQKLTRLLKGEASSLLGLAITFSTGDGD
ncbi:MAG: imelysin family protein [Bacteroidota bacterium]